MFILKKGVPVVGNKLIYNCLFKMLDLWISGFWLGKRSGRTTWDSTEGQEHYPRAEHPDPRASVIREEHEAAAEPAGSFRARSLQQGGRPGRADRKDGRSDIRAENSGNEVERVGEEV